MTHYSHYAEQAKYEAQNPKFETMTENQMFQ
jgi:hypothetical protein